MLLLPIVVPDLSVSAGAVETVGDRARATPDACALHGCVAAGRDHTCVLPTVGSVYCYGDNAYGQASDYEGSDAIGVSAGYEYTCVLLATGNVDCYGGYAGWNVGQTADHLGGNAVDVAAGVFHTCVLLSTGNVDCYGSNSGGQSADYVGGNAVDVAVGWAHTCILLSTGNVDCYGDNGVGQATDHVGGNAVSVATGAYHTCVVLSTGSVDCHGYGGSAEAANRLGWTAVDVAASPTGSRTCVLFATSLVECYTSAPRVAMDHLWNVSGVPWLLDTASPCTFAWIDCDEEPWNGAAIDPVVAGAVDVAVGGSHVCVLRASRDVECFGHDEDGETADYFPAQDYDQDGGSCGGNTCEPTEQSDPIDPSSRPETDDDGDGVQNQNELTRAQALGLDATVFGLTTPVTSMVAGAALDAYGAANDIDGDGVTNGGEILEGSSPVNLCPPKLKLNELVRPCTSTPDSNDDDDCLANKDERSAASAMGALPNGEHCITATRDDFVWVHLGKVGSSTTVVTPDGQSMTVTNLRCEAGAHPVTCDVPLVAKVLFDGTPAIVRYASDGDPLPPASVNVEFSNVRVWPPTLAGAPVEGTWLVHKGTNVHDEPAGFRLVVQGRAIDDVGAASDDITLTGSGEEDCTSLDADTTKLRNFVRAWNWHRTSANTIHDACQPGGDLISPPQESLSPFDLRLYLA